MDWLAPGMKSVPLIELVRHCDSLLQPQQFTDYDRAHNGLQVSNRRGVTRIAAAVDASLATVKMAAAAGANLLVVHHGLFWGQTLPWTGRRLELIQALVESDLAVYSMHLPLDAHRTLGNAAQFARSLGLKSLKPFFQHKGRSLGWQASMPIRRDVLSARLAQVLGHPPILLPGGGEECHRIGICTGGAGAELNLAAQEGVDTFITGEGPHWTHALAEEAGINVFYGGHYATETFGVKALSAALSKKFGVPWEFLDHPSGL
jgi:dinuclear metal center YbgI/SA1388 family protein